MPPAGDPPGGRGRPPPPRHEFHLRRTPGGRRRPPPPESSSAASDGTYFSSSSSRATWSGWAHGTCSTYTLLVLRSVPMRRSTMRQQRWFGTALVVQLAGQPVQVTAHHLFAKTGLAANLSLPGEAHAVVRGAVCQPQQDQPALRQHIGRGPTPSPAPWRSWAWPHPCENAGDARARTCLTSSVGLDFLSSKAPVGNSLLQGAMEKPARATLADIGREHVLCTGGGREADSPTQAAARCTS